MLDFDALLAQNLIINVHIFIAFFPSYLVKSFLSWLKTKNKKKQYTHEHLGFAFSGKG